MFANKVMLAMFTVSSHCIFLTFQMENNDEEQDFLDNAEENANFTNTFANYGPIVQFLQRRERVYARSMALTLAEQHTFLKMDTDIDGCVVEHATLKAINIPVRHLTLCPKGQINVSNLKRVLKKHIDLTAFTQADLSNFNSSAGFQLFYESGGSVGLVFYRFAKSTFYQRLYPTSKHSTFPNVKNQFTSKICNFGKTPNCSKNS